MEMGNGYLGVQGGVLVLLEVDHLDLAEFGGLGLAFDLVVVQGLI